MKIKWRKKKKKRPDLKDITKLAFKRINNDPLLERGTISDELLKDIMGIKSPKQLDDAFSKQYYNLLAKGYFDVEEFGRDIQGLTIEELQTLFTIYNKKGTKLFIGDANNLEVDEK